MKIAWHIFLALLHVLVVIGILSLADTRFEKAALAGLIELYSAVLLNFSLLGEAADINNRAGFVRFRILAEAQGMTGNEHGTFAEQEKALAETLSSHNYQVLITRITHGVVSTIALFVIIHTIWTSL